MRDFSRAIRSVDVANPYRGRELDFVREALGVRTWAGQRAMLTRLLEKRFVSVRGCRKATKTHAAAFIVEAFMQCAPTIAITTAPGTRQVETLLWGKMRTMHAGARIQLAGEMHTCSLKIGPEHYALGFSTNTTDRFQGFHAGVDVPDDPDAPPPLVDPEDVARVLHAAAKRAPSTRLLFVMDEAAGIEQMIYDAVKGSFLGEHVYVLYLANPTISIHEPHDYARSHLPGSAFWRIKIAARLDVPDPVEADESFLVPYWAATYDDLCRQYPESDAAHKPYVLAQFADLSVPNTILSYADLAAADVDEPEDGTPSTLVKRGPHIGVDTAWTGDDANVAALWLDSVKVSEDAWHSQDTLASWERIKALREHWAAAIDRPIPWRSVHIDEAPVAAGIIDAAKRDGCDLDCVHFGGSPTGAWSDVIGDPRCLNRRAELYWTFRELIRTKRARLPRQFEKSWQEFAATTYLRSGGAEELKIEPKEKIKARLGRSPDHADADVLAFAKTQEIRAFRI